MKKLKYILFIMILFLVPNVYGAELTNKVQALPGFGGGTYYGQTPTSPTVAVYNYLGTRYQGKLSLISFYLDSDDWNWDYGKTYTIELYMETNDWDNNFMYPQVYRANTNGDTLGSNLAKSSVTFVSNKKIKFTFKTPDDVMNTYMKFRVYSSNVNTTGITRITNYNFNKVIITQNQTSSGGSSGGSGGTSPTPTPTPTMGPEQIIDSSIQNTEDIINTNNQNTQDIIENANNNFSQATETITGSLDELLGKKCSNLFDSSTFVFGDITGGYTNIRISSRQDLKLNNGTYTLSTNLPSTYNFSIQVQNVGVPPLTTYPTYIYDSGWQSSGTTSKTFTLSSSGWLVIGIRKSDNSSFTDSDLQTIKNSEFMLVSGSTASTYCVFGSTSSMLDETNKKLDLFNATEEEIKDAITSGAIDNKTSFFTNFQDNAHGLTGIITIPLSTIQSLTNTSCVSLNIPIPFTNRSVSLPCMTEVYQTYVPSIYSLWQVVSFGIISYFICIDIFKMVKGFKDPNEDKVEVLDL